MKDALEDMYLFSDKIIFHIDEDYFKISTTGMKGDGEISYIHGESITNSYDSMFNIEKLKDIFRASKFSESCELSLGDDMPCQITF